MIGLFVRLDIVETRSIIPTECSVWCKSVSLPVASVCVALTDIVSGTMTTSPRCSTRWANWTRCGAWKDSEDSSSRSRRARDPGARTTFSAAWISLFRYLSRSSTEREERIFFFNWRIKKIDSILQRSINRLNFLNITHSKKKKKKSINFPSSMKF